MYPNNNFSKQDHYKKTNIRIHNIGIDFGYWNHYHGGLDKIKDLKTNVS